MQLSNRASASRSRARRQLKVMSLARSVRPLSPQGWLVLLAESIG